MRLGPILFRFFCARTFTAALAIALLLATPGQSQAADPEPKRVLMLHSFGLQLQAVDRLCAGHSRRNKQTQQRGVSGPLAFECPAEIATNQTLHLSSIFAPSMLDQPPDLIVAIGAPAANFVQRHRKDLFPKTPMLFTAVERRRVAFDKLTEYDTVVAVVQQRLSIFLRIFCVYCPSQRPLPSLSVLRRAKRFGGTSRQVHRAVGRPRAISMVQRTFI